MKKIIAMLLALMMACMLVPALAEEADWMGEWYGNMYGMPVTLTINEDGTYILEVMGQAMDGAYEVVDGALIMDGDESSPLVYEDGALVMKSEYEEEDVVFTREATEGITLAPAVADAPLEAFAGSWTAAYVGLGDAVVDVALLGESVDVTIDGNKVTLGGSMFEGLEAEFAYADGALTFAVDMGEGDSINIKLYMLEDGMLAMDMEAAGEAMTFYLEPVAAENAA